MRRLLYTSALLAVLTACTENEVDEMKMNTSSIVQKSERIRSYDEAFQEAQNALSLLEPCFVTRSDEPRKISLTDNKVYWAEPKTRAGQNTMDTLFYVFNFEDNKGFAVISASKKTEAVLAITESGNYDPYVVKGIEGFDYYMDAAKTYIQNTSKSEPIRGNDPMTKDSLISITHQQQGPFVTVKWGQTYPEGEFCPNGIAGCTNTALAQIMSYYLYPSAISITYPNADVTSQTLDWSSIKAHQTGHSISQCSSQEVDVHKSIGRLLRQLGHMNNSIYSSYGTSTFAEIVVKPTMQNLNYCTGSSFTDYDWNTIVNQLDNCHLFLINGMDLVGGHSWVIDGYLQTTSVYQHFVYGGVSIGSPDGWVPVGYVYNYVRLCHFNWGWYGDCDGYFSSGVFDTQQANLYDESDSNTHSYDFGSDVTILPIWQ